LAENVQSWVSLFKTQLQSLDIPWEGLQPIDTDHIRNLEIQYVEAWKYRLHTKYKHTDIHANTKFRVQDAA
jgi:hypothetical protein